MTEVSSNVPTLSVQQVKSYIQLLSEICDGLPIIDAHVHATEIMFDQIRYRSVDEPIMSVNGPEQYQGPVIEPAQLTVTPSGIDSRFKDRIARMAFDRLYRFSGPTVLLDQMRVAGVDRAVLLPVAHKDHPLSPQMDVIDACCRAGSSFIAGFSVHDSVPDADLVGHIQQAVRAHGVRVIKIHHNFSEIDITARSGLERTNAILAACGELGLPVVIHGGESPILGDLPERRFGTLENLKELDWSATQSPVVVAHFGVYGPFSQSDKIPDSSISIVRDLLDANSHMYLDTSGVMYPAILRMMAAVDPQRLIFGSDAYYVPMYRQVALVMHAVNELKIDIGVMREVASRRAARIFGLD